MRILAFDTTLGACSAAVFDAAAGRILAHAWEPIERGHAEALVVMVRGVLDRSGGKLSDIERIAVTVGPGTFTGVRIGLSLARGLKLALGTPVCGLTSLEAIRLNVRDNPDGRAIATLIDARRGEFYLAAWSADGARIVAPCAVRHQAAAGVVPPGSLVLGPGADRFLELAGAREALRARVCDLPNAARIAEAAASLTPSDEPPQPVYLRPSGAELPARARSEIAIVEAGIEHAEVLSALHGECFAEDWPAADIARIMALPGAVALLAFAAAEPDRPAGFALARRAADEAEIISIGTDPTFRRRGIARRLVGGLADRLIGTGAQALFIEVAAGNEAARALYQSLGFAPAGLRKGYYARAGSPADDAIVMRLAL
ncbi:MAG TPA: tRNA (adenosine(37)-N6)-threonylcarbamoyltransferase complex dimerization subunit type 1 TsaB [Aestuariivirgaceae bacterium]|nr:tRNA (adenosine(37)-N6)-threonylcarbamoyltransferase complex dimerization subunit type 1 TsaB [Aestuariivirgaceae bacterium]